MLDRMLRYFIWELRAITRAPATFGAAVLIVAAVIATGLVWSYRKETALLQQQVSEYRDKLGGVSADEARKALDALADELTDLQARLKPRRVSSYQRQTISDRLKVPTGAQYTLAIVHEGGCWDCPQFAADFDEALRGIPGWLVSNRVIMGLVQRPASGLAVVVADRDHPSEQESVLLQALQAARIEFDLQGARSSQDKGPQLLLSARPPQ
jgi:hypothetical protein